MIFTVWVLTICGVFLSLLISDWAIKHDEEDTEEYHGWWPEKNIEEK